MSDDWDPFADPAEAAETQQEGNAAVAEDDAEKGSEALPVMPRPYGRASEPMTSEAFASALASIVSSWDMEPPALSNTASFPEGESQLQDLYERASGAERDTLLRFLSITSRQAVQQLSDFREERRSSAQLFIALQSLQGQLGSLLSDEIVIVPPAAPFRGTVVFVFGYGGSSVADMMDCPRAYQTFDPGCLVVLLVFPGHDGGPRGQAQLGLALEAAVNAWADLGNGEAQLFIHLFSNLGMMTWIALMNLWKRQVLRPDTNRLRGQVPELQSVLKGLALDSSPDPDIKRQYSMASLVNGTAAGLAGANGWDINGHQMNDNDIAKEAYRAKMEVMREGSMVKLYYDSLTDLQIRNMTAVDCKDVHAMEPPVPMLFLYSENDKVISAAHVEQYIEELTRRAQPPPEPQRYKLKNSAHCMHRLGDTKAYWNAVLGVWQAVGLPRD